ncbi:MAG: hypothetical protein ACI9P5_001998 [Saprospiraceae bacterium]|jgi:hypothetical protein|tara:strand:+ start:3276 stop:3587 length:312 start_codon:yes stop_codon:yes gene_type:complete
MKLVLITSVNQFKQQIQKILKNCNIQNYSFQDVVGHKDISSVADRGNWFVGDRFESNSITFFAMVPAKIVDCLFKEVERFNSNLESLSRIHLSILNIEKTNDV